VRIIDADELVKKALTESCFDSRTEDVFLDLVDSMPTVDAKTTFEAEPVRHGTWKLLPNGDGVCDQCHVILKNVWDEDGWLHFCSCCGAKMDGGVN
jgi:hypothetical protein